MTAAALVELPVGIYIFWFSLFFPERRHWERNGWIVGWKGDWKDRLAVGLCYSVQRDVIRNKLVD